MHAKDVICDHPVVFFVHVVGDYEKKIKTGEKGVRKSDVLVGIFVDIILESISSEQSSYEEESRSTCPYIGFAAATTLHLALRVVCMPAFAMVTVCCSITS